MIETLLCSRVIKKPVPKGRWIRLADFPLDYLEFSSACYHNGFIYTFGGMTSGSWEGAINDIYRYDIANDTWVKIATTGTIPPARRSPVVYVDNDELVVIGGEYVGVNYSQDIYRLNLETLVWRMDTPFSFGVHRAGYFLTSPDNPIKPSTLYIFGSNKASGRWGESRDAKLVESGNFTPSGLWMPSAIYRDGVGYVIGGATGQGNGLASDNAFSFSIEDNTSTELPRLPITTMASALGIFGEFLFSFAGMKTATTGNQSTQVYSLTEGMWTVLEDSKYILPVSKIGAVSVFDGTRVYVIGGRDNARSFYAFELV